MNVLQLWLAKHQGGVVIAIKEDIGWLKDIQEMEQSIVGVEENVSIYCIEQMDESFSRKYGLNFLENLSKNSLEWEPNSSDQTGDSKGKQ